MLLDLSSPRRSRKILISLARSSGQAVVEFTLVFLLFLVIAWIPADFGLAFYTAQLAQNASRDGARIAAADPKLESGMIPGDPYWTATCTMPSCTGNILGETAARISSALLPDARIDVTLEADSPLGTPPRCDRKVTVTISGNYTYFFYQLLEAFGNTVPDTLNIVRSTSMRWEHQFGC